MHQGQPQAWPPAVITPSLAVARLVLGAAPAGGVTLLAPYWLLAGPGVGFFLAILTAIRDEAVGTPRAAMLDCGQAPGLALAALRSLGDVQERVGLVMDASLPSFAQVSQAAEEKGYAVLATLPPALTLTGRNLTALGTKRSIDHWFNVPAP